MSNYGQHRVKDRLILEGFGWKLGALRRVSTPQRDQIWFLPMLKERTGNEKAGSGDKIGVDC
ncbi:MAG TPA: hypothetical protein VGN93_04935 [Shinella sp.]|jgi:hypothetical protein|uniref:hypothetical protein n=1 Tax=Shinella sp. TaxID=1870904 RepID=UPI002E0D3DA7|nr:hypothetical protein [Shinella sp.]